MTVIYRERHFTSPYTCVDFERKLHAISYFIPDGTSLYYFKVDRYNYKTVGKEDIIRIEGV